MLFKISEDGTNYLEFSSNEEYSPFRGYIIRCKNCVNYDSDECMCEEWNIPRDRTDYCSAGRAWTI